MGRRYEEQKLGENLMKPLTGVVGDSKAPREVEIEVEKKWVVQNGDKRKRNEQNGGSKRQKITQEGEEEQAAEHSESRMPTESGEREERKPKKKVAVFIGYAGTGYKGMQINPDEKTIEGDLFNAFVAAGAISKANSDDVKKSSLVRCARTDKGVHAAGNMISLKLIIEDPKVIEKINENLPPQIRVWGIQRTNTSFSCYQACDSRWYEYLIPTYSFLPPHPQSYLGKKIYDSAQKEGTLEDLQTLQEDVAQFWDNAEKVYVDPILNKLDAQTRAIVMETIHKSEDGTGPSYDDDQSSIGDDSESVADDTNINGGTGGTSEERRLTESGDDTNATVEKLFPLSEASEPSAHLLNDSGVLEGVSKTLTSLEIAIRDVKEAYIKAKKAFRISDSRRQRVQDSLQTYVGTHNFHNYTVRKHHNDPSAKRHIKSFKVRPDPIIINNTEWLSLKVHGQSFMMHQIRKMIGMAALVVRCGTSLERITESYGSDRMSIPKAPGLGLLLERPVFDSYNVKAKQQFQREVLDFGKFERSIEEFKQREIYDRIFKVEDAEHRFHVFFDHLDHFVKDYFLWATATGIPATKQAIDSNRESEAVLDSVGLGEEDAGKIATDPAGGAVTEG